jgi:hypothetical protein
MMDTLKDIELQLNDAKLADDPTAIRRVISLQYKAAGVATATGVICLVPRANAKAKPAEAWSTWKAANELVGEAVDLLARWRTAGQGAVTER